MDERLFEDIDIAKYYQRYRPDYKRSDIQEKVIPFLREKLKQTPDSLAVDVGCGTGQLTRILAPFFTRVLGVDISEAQITVAKEFTSEENIEYRWNLVLESNVINVYFYSSKVVDIYKHTENLSFVSSESVDMVSVAAAIHYFDPELFYKEIARILSPGGCLAVIKSSTPSRYISMVPETTNAEAISQCRSLMEEITQLSVTNMGTRAKMVCKTLQYPDPPYQEDKRFTMQLWKPLNGFEGFAGFLKSMGGLRRYRKENPHEEDVIEVLQKRLGKILSEITSTPETFPLYLNGQIQ